MTTPTETGPEALRDLAHHGTASAHLPSPATVRARADRRRRNRRVAGGVAVAVAAVVLAPTVGGLGAPRTTGTGPSAPVASDPATDPTTDPATRVVDIRTYADRWVVPDVEGGISSVVSLSRSPLPTGWRLETRDDGATRLATVATTDGAPHCLTARREGSLGLQECDDSVAGQALTVRVLDRRGQVNIRTVAGLLAATPDHGLRPDSGPESPAVVFVLE
ncbi:hypothetical protein [Nocardioides sp. CFH 31398]|uniref:hypothetical protein n=1 Tax=Nocardioides sp. CFH 31398 TaxID=2919579 RepID=UPI001F052142|nr:hypothetical protein [Nocardioides sp. CFH 31398]MCH1867344.1 hypothetical protein [Nocardioides sp. CFH 31398]